MITGYILNNKHVQVITGPADTPGRMIVTVYHDQLLHRETTQTCGISESSFHRTLRALIIKNKRKILYGVCTEIQY